ncbi:alpha/beta fold hydrolase [bacterium]|nr:alpha/beta fold hydrolase [bacterium]
MISRTLRLSDGRAVRALQAGAGETLVLIHGVGMRAEAWAPQIAALAGGYRVIAVDMAGHGQSDPLPRNPLTAGPRLPDYVAWAARVLDALGAGPVNLAGHSMGALVAGGLAIERPDLIRRVALLNSVHRRSTEARAAVLARAAEIARGTSDIEAPLARWFGPQDAVVRAEVAGWLASVDAEGYATAYRAFAEGDAVYADRFGEIRCPMLVLTGAEDANSSPMMARDMAAAAPLGQAEVIAGHRHMVNLTAPEAVNCALHRWLQTTEVTA